MRVAIGQIAPVFLDRERTLAKVVHAVREAAEQGAALIAFGETVVPAYPHWLSRTDGARFESSEQKELHALYLAQSVRLGGGANDLEAVCRVAGERGIAVVLGVAELGMDRGGHTVYCSRVVIGAAEGSARGAPASVLSVHRKLMPTYEERLAWGTGDGAGLVTHRVGAFTMGALNCWENWMPLARAALHAQGEDLHVALWPGCERNTVDITRFIAIEARSYVISACALLRESDVPVGVPLRDRLVAPGEVISDGGSCIADPAGRWVVPPVVNQERVIVADLDPQMVRRERQNFDVSGHYARPDVLRLVVDRRRQSTAEFLDDDGPTSR